MSVKPNWTGGILAVFIVLTSGPHESKPRKKLRL
jgi:hypothetical protein